MNYKQLFSTKPPSLFYISIQYKKYLEIEKKYIFQINKADGIYKIVWIIDKYAY